MKKLLVACAAACCFMFGHIAAASAEIKVGIVDIRGAIEQTEKDGVIKKLKSETEKRENKAKATEKKLLQTKQEIEESAAVLSEDALKEKALAYQQQLQKFQQEVQTYQQEMQDMSAKLLGEVQTKMAKITEDIAKEKGLDLVIERNEGGIVYAKDSFDFTAELIKRYKAN
jgi:Skp family chaperone for outer membrane proteins